MDLKIVPIVLQVVIVLVISVPLCEGVPKSNLCFINEAWTNYDTDKRFCCNGTLETIDDGKQCCHEAGKFYYVQNKVCCGTEVHNRFDGDVEYDCCDSKLISLNTNICCNDTVWQLPKERSEDMMCCGAELVNRTTMLCCQNDDYPKKVRKHLRLPNIDCCGHIPVDLAQEKCLWDEKNDPVLISMNQDYCEGQVINQRQQSCCNGQIYDQPYLNPVNVLQLNPEQACCGTTGYNPITDKCCPSAERDGRVIPNHDQLHCCRGNDNGYINGTYQLCCNGTTRNKTSKYDMCCGHHIIDSRSHGCCEQAPFNKGTHFCCRGLPSGILQQGKKCCDGQELVEGSLCCDNTLVNKNHHRDDKCCLDDHQSTYVTYNSTKKACYNGQLQTRMSSDDSNCHGKRYRKSEAVCCDGDVHRFPSEDTLGCCRRYDLLEIPYSEKNQLCCSGNIFNMSVQKAECCRGKAYPIMANDNPCLKQCGKSYHNKEETVCCGRQMFSKTENGDACCGNKPYFSYSQKCCDRKIHNSTEGQCCASELYDPGTHSCCGGYEVIRSNTESKKCCNNVMVYSSRDGRCKDNRTVERKNKRTPVDNICNRWTWRDQSGIEVEICGRSRAIHCTLLKKKFKKTTKEFEFIMKCQNLKRHVEDTKDSFVVHSKTNILKLRVVSDKVRRRCRVKKNKKIIVFFDKEVTQVQKKKHQHELKITKEDAFRVVENTKTVRKAFAKVNKKFCEHIFDYMTDQELREYNIKVEW